MRVIGASGRWMVAAVLLSLVPTAGWAAFTPPVTVSPTGQTGEQEQVAIRENGSVLAVWVRSDGNNDRVQARSRSAAGVLSTVFTLSPAGTDGRNPQLALDGSGSFYVVWDSFSGGRFRVLGRPISSAGNVGALEFVSIGTLDASDPQLARNAAGATIITWVQTGAADSRVQVRTRTAAGAFSSIQTLSPAGNTVIGPDVAIDGDGDAVVVWTRFNAGTFNVFARARSKTAVLGAVQAISATGDNIEFQQVVMDISGRALFAWGRDDSTGMRVQTRSRTAAGVLGAPISLSPAGDSASSIKIAADGDGTTQLIWTSINASAVYARVAPTGTAGGAFGTTHRVTPATDDAVVPDLAIDAAGNGRIVWNAQNRDAIRTRVHTAAGALQPTASLITAPVFNPRVAVTSDGDVAVAWDRLFSGMERRVQLTVGP